MTRVLVTGGAGFIGSHLVRAALDAGERVRVLDDLSSGRRENLAGLAGVELVEASVADASAVADAAAGCDVIYHQAAVVSVPQSVEDPLGSHAVNLTGTLHVLEAARRAQVERVVLASSCAVYGNDESVPKTETMPTEPQSPYAVQKLGGELYCARYRELYGVQSVALRYFNVYGPRQDPTSMYAGVIPRFVDMLVRGDVPAVHGDGLQTRDFVHVSDVVAANRAAARSGAAAGRVVNIGRGQRVTILALLHQIAEQLGRSVEPTHGEARAGDVRHSLADLSLARELLDWEPQVDLADGLVDTVAWYRQGAA